MSPEGPALERVNSRRCGCMLINGEATEGLFKGGAAAFTAPTALGEEGAPDGGHG